MPLAGGQLPITAFLPEPSRRARKTGSSKASQKRKSSPGRAPEAEPPKKKRKQKENLTPQTSLKDVESRLGEPSSSSRPRRSPRRRRNSDPEGVKDQKDDAGQETVAVLDETGTNVATQKDIIDLTGLDDGPRLEAATTETREQPLTPQHRGRHHGALAADSFPSPPLTAPNARRSQKARRDEERRVEEMLDEPGGAPHEEMSDPAPSTDRPVQPADLRHSSHCDHSNADGGVAPASRLRDSSMVLMPPPDVPPQAASTFTLHRPVPVPVQKPSSTSSDKWVPSSQTQELSIPACYGASHDPPSDPKPRAPLSGGTQVVPSSQLDEIELQMPSASADGPCTPGAPSSSLQVSASPTAESGGSGEAHSPEVVESSQQMEAEMDATWAETIAARHAAIGWSKEADGESRPRTPSPSPRKAESQDYDAQDELSSQEDTSQPSFEIRTSPLHVPPQMTQSSASYASQSTVSTPPQVRRFRDVFKRRDGHSNERPSQQASDGRRSLSPMPYAEDGDVHDPLDDISVSPPPIPEHHSSDDSYSYGSSLSQTQPTPVRNFMALFDSQRDGEPSQVADVW